MSKLKVILIAGGVAVAAGYVFRKQLKLDQYLHRGADWIIELGEDITEARYVAASRRRDAETPVWMDDGAVDNFRAHPETGEVRTRPAAQ